MNLDRVSVNTAPESRWKLKQLKVTVANLVVLLAAAFAVSGVATAQEPQRGGTLDVGLHVAVRSFDPHKAPNQGEAWVIGLVYSRLVDLSPDLQIVPELAESWVQPDPQTFVFTLRDDAVFHNGTPVTSEDVKYSLERLLNPETGSTKRTNYTSIESIETPDPRTVVLHLSQPNSSLLTHLASTSASIVSREVVEANGDLSVSDGGSGPFLLGPVQADNSLTLERNPNYYEGDLPYLDAVRMVPIPDNQARNASVRAGDTDLVTFVTANFISLLRGDARVEIPAQEGSSGQFYAIFFNNEVAPFDDPRVRRAIAMAIDRELIVSVALGNEGFPLEAGPIPSWHWAALDPVYTAPDLDSAKALLAEAGYADGFTFPIRMWSSQDFVLRTILVLQQALAPLGIEIEIDQQGDWVTYWSAVESGNYVATIQGIGGNVDPDQYLRERFGTGGGSNVMRYSSEEFDALVAEGLTTSDLEARKAIYDQAQTILTEDSPAVFLYNMKQTEAHRANVEGFVHLPTLDLTSLKSVWLED